MIERYLLLSQRLQAELPPIERVVTRVEKALSLASQSIEEQDYFLASAALDLHGFYTGVERLFELIAADIDRTRPDTRHRHRDLLVQMELAVPGVRPAVLRAVTRSALQEYLEFRHVVRNVYTFNLRPARLVELIQGLRPTFDLVQEDIQNFAEFLDAIIGNDQLPQG